MRRVSSRKELSLHALSWGVRRGGPGGPQATRGRRFRQPRTLFDVMLRVRAANDLDRHRREPGATDRAGCRRHEINDATADERAAVIDANDDGATASLVRDAHQCSERKRLV